MLITFWVQAIDGGAHAAVTTSNFVIVRDQHDHELGNIGFADQESAIQFAQDAVC